MKHSFSTAAIEDRDAKELACCREVKLRPDLLNLR
jgi:hypothetical protein